MKMRTKDDALKLNFLLLLRFLCQRHMMLKAIVGTELVTRMETSLACI